MTGLKGGLTIIINTDDKKDGYVDVKRESGLKYDIGITDKDSESTHVKRASELDNKLLIKNRLDDAEMTELTAEVSGFVSELLKEDRPEMVRWFMDKSKYHLSPDMLSFIKDEIESYNKGKKK